MATTITNPKDTVIQAIFLKGHLKLMSLGMKHSSLTQTDVLNKAAQITGKSYKKGKKGLETALKDIVELIDAANAKPVN